MTILESVLAIFVTTTTEELFNSTLYVCRQHLLLCFSSICREDLLTGQAQMAGWGYKEQTWRDEMGQNKNWTTKHRNRVSLAADWKVCKKYFRINFLRRRRKSADMKWNEILLQNRLKKAKKRKEQALLTLSPLFSETAGSCTQRTYTAANILVRVWLRK